MINKPSVNFNNLHAYNINFTLEKIIEISYWVHVWEIKIYTMFSFKSNIVKLVLEHNRNIHFVFENSLIIIIKFKNIYSTNLQFNYNEVKHNKFCRFEIYRFQI